MRFSRLKNPIQKTMSLGSIDWGASHGRMKRSPRFGRLNVDLPLLLTLLAISALGFVVLYSAVGQDSSLLIRQGARFAVGFAAFFMLAQVPPRYLRIWTPWLFFAVMGLLVYVMIDGVTGKGAQRWLNLGFVTFQPSELMKLAVPLMLAWFLHDRPLPPSLVQLVVMALIVGAPALIIADQPDLGTALLVVTAGGLTILLAGISVRLISFFAVAGLVSAPILWRFMLDYQRARVLTFLNPETDPLGTGYNIIQSKIAIGSGGLFGKGWFNGTQAHLEFLPERSTDFIFAVMAEEFGLLGLLLLLALYLVLVGRGLYIASQAQDTFTRLLAGGLSLTFFVYVFVNAGMVSGLLPIVGVPLPLVSAGGTSMVTLLAGFGMLAAVSGHRKLLAS
jgi:rod shape determining protein RodA